ncbi:MAG: efflux RND transporter periplasmic adaptor subunit [Myxococcota bacterium]|jgi:RND family efflux transporter MFP subunit
MPGNRWVVAAGFLLLALGLVWCAREPLSQVEVVRAVYAPIEVTVATNGTVEPIAKAPVRSRLDGRVVEVPDPGVKVELGDVILRIDAGPVESEWATARSLRLAAQDSLRAAEDHFERVQKRAETDAMLFEAEALTRHALDEGRAELREAAAQFRHLEGAVPLQVEALDLRIAELVARRDASSLRATFAGTVYRTHVKVGESVRVGDPVLHVAELGRLRVRTNIDQVDLGRVAVGQSVRIESNAYPGRAWRAQMAEVIPNVALKDSRRVAEGLAEVEPPTEGLVPGMTVDVEILIDASPRALQVPIEAVFSDPVGSHVYRLDDGRVRETRVRLGRATVSSVEVLEGLADGDWVVLGPLSNLSDGDAVKAQKRGDG